MVHILASGTTKGKCPKTSPCGNYDDFVVVLISPNSSLSPSMSSGVISPTSLVILWDWASIALLMVTDLAAVDILNVGLMSLGKDDCFFLKLVILVLFR